MFKYTKQTKKFTSIFAFLLLLHIFSCGFAYEKQVTGKYYIVGVDTKDDLDLSYKLGSGGYVGRAPGQLKQFGFNQKFLVAKTQESNSGKPSYYIIDMTKDSELALEETFRIGPLTEKEYNLTWREKLNIQLKNVR